MYQESLQIDDKVRKEFKTTSESSGQENQSILNQNIIETEFNATII